MSDTHDIHDFLFSAQQEIQAEYDRIQKRAIEDPGTAGDQGEENWATLLRNWLPSYFHVVTKGRILCENDYASPQVDVLVLHPSYPKILLDKKLYFAGGVAAAFECKITLKASHVDEAVETAALIRQNMRSRKGCPYLEFNSSIIYGLIAHSHSWNKENSKPANNISKVLLESDEKYVNHPIQTVDFITVSNLGTWSGAKHALTYPENLAMTCYLQAKPDHPFRTDDKFSPIGVLLLGLFSRLSWTYPDMRNLEWYFRKLLGSSGKGVIRLWPLTIYSEQTMDGISRGRLVDNQDYDEWSRKY